MRAETITKTYYTFDELSKERQEKVLDNHREINLQDEFAFEGILEEFVEKVEEQTGIELSQDDLVWDFGDRNACLGVYSSKVEAELQKQYPELVDIDVPEKVGTHLTHLGGGICNPVTTEQGRAEPEFDEEEEEEDLQKAYKERQHEKEREEVTDKVDKVIELSREYFGKAEEQFQYLLSDEAVAETIRANEIEFEE